MFTQFKKTVAASTGSFLMLASSVCVFSQTTATSSTSRSITTNTVAVAKTDQTSVKTVSVNPYAPSPAVKKVTHSESTPPEVPVVPKKQSSGGSQWEFSFAPYLYMTGISGTVGARGRTATFDRSFGDIWNSLDIGLMGTFEAKKGRFVILNDFIWTKLSEERDTRGGLYSTGKLGVKLFTWTPEAGYRAYESKKGTFDVVGGVRITSVQNSLTFTTGTLPGFDVSQRKTWAAPVFGLHGLVNLSPRFFLSTILDAGGGFGTHVTGQFYGGAGYRITPRIAFVGGYRYLKNDYNDDNGFKFDTAMNGILVGAKFKF